jgi:hypothetical protein
VRPQINHHLAHRDAHLHVIAFGNVARGERACRAETTTLSAKYG